MTTVTSILCLLQNYYLKKYQLSYPLPENFFPKKSIANKYQIVKVGNSHSQDGISFKGFNTTHLDLSSVAQKFEIDLAMLKHYRKQIDKNAIILIAVTPISFSHSAVNSQRGLQSGYYRRISPFLLPNINAGDYLESEFLPFTRVGYFLRKRNIERIQERISLEQRSPDMIPKPTPTLDPSFTPTPTPISKYVPSSDDFYYNVQAIELEESSPSALPADAHKPDYTYRENIHFTYVKWMETDEFSPKYFSQNRKDLQNLIAYCQKQGWRPILITIPITTELEQAMPQNYKQNYLYDQLDQIYLSGVEYWDFSQDDKFRNDTSLFFNSDHLNPKGSAIFSYHVLQTLIENNYLEQSADGYDYGQLFSNEKI